MWSPQNVEAGLQAASIVRIGYALLGPALHGQRGPGAALHAFSMAMLAILASFLDRCKPSWFQDHPLYVFRACSQAGLAQGLLALPSLATSIFVATRSWWWQQAARLFLASSFQVLFWFAWTASTPKEIVSKSNNTADLQKAERQVPLETTSRPGLNVMEPATTGPQTQITRTGTSPAYLPLGSSAAARLLFLTTTVVGCLLSASNALLHAAQPPPPASPQFLLPGSVFELPRDITASAWVLQGALLLAIVPSLDHLAADLPRSFTPGEMGILVQALLALVAGSCAYLAGASRQGLLHVLWSPHVVQLVGPDPGMHVPAFCILVLFWVLAMAACSTMALQSTGSGSGGGASRQEEGSERGVQQALAAAETMAVSSSLTAGLRQRQIGTAEKGAAGQAPARAEYEKRAALKLQYSRSERESNALHWHVTVASRAAAGVGFVVSFAMLIDLALWVLGRFVAASSQPRLATLAYWFGCLAVAVPFMYAVSRASAARSQELQQQKEWLQQFKHQEQQEEQHQREEGRRSKKPSLETEKEEARVIAVAGNPDEAALGQLSGALPHGSKPETPADCVEDKMLWLDGVKAGAEGIHLSSSLGGHVSHGEECCGGGKGVPRSSFPRGTCDYSGNGHCLEGSLVGGGPHAARTISGPCLDGFPALTAHDFGRLLNSQVASLPQQQQQHLLQKQKALPERGERPTRRSMLLAALFRALGVPHIVMRKGYHILAIILFLPAFGWDVRMLQASLAVAGAVLVFVEVVRCLGPMRLRRGIGSFMSDFADARDSGPIYVTHFTLLLGIAVPVWLGDSVCGAAAGAMMGGLYGSEAAEPMQSSSGGGPLSPRLSAAAARLLPSCRTVLGLSGLVSLGSGDTAAACVGFLLGQRRLFRHGKKTWEGTLSGAAAMLGSWAVVVWWMDVGWALSWRLWAALTAVTASVSMLEAVTQQLDNVVVPLYYMTHLVLTMTGH